MRTDTTPVLKKDDLVRYFLDSFRPSLPPQVGVEYEHLGLSAESGGAVPLEKVEAVLRHLTERHGWSPEASGGTVYLHRASSGVVSLEPGGQVELSTDPVTALETALMEEERFLAELREAGERFGVLWAGLGHHPVASAADVPWIPKERYAIMREFFMKKGKLAHSMMQRTASIQVTLDYASEHEAAEKMLLAMKCSPVFTALFANSCLVEGRLTGFRSFRSHVWQNTDPDRCGLVPAVFKEGFGFGDWVEYTLDVPLFFLERDGKLIGNIGKTFRQYMKEGFDGRPATRRDWETHLTTLFPEARFRQWIEVRSIDRLPGALAYGAPVFVRHLFDRPDTRAEALKILGELTFEDCRRGLEAAARSGLEAKIGRRNALEISQDLVRVVEERASAAMSVFERRAFESVKQQVYDKKMCPADEIIRELGSGDSLMTVIRRRAL